MIGGGTYKKATPGMSSETYHVEKGTMARVERLDRLDIPMVWKGSGDY